MTKQQTDLPKQEDSGRTAKGQFRKGVSGNPGGLSGISQEHRERNRKLREFAPECLEILFAAARASEPWAVKLVVERIAPIPKATYPTTDPEIAEQLKTVEGIIGAAAEGTLASDHANSLISNLKAAEELRILSESKGAVSVIEITTTAGDDTCDHVTVRAADED